MKDLLNIKFDNYNSKDHKLALLFFYNYLKTITIIKNKSRKDGNILFATNYLNQILQVQCLLKITFKFY